MATMAILGAGYVAASSGISRHESRAGWMPFNCGHLLVLVKTVSSMGVGAGLFWVVLATDVELCSGVVAPWCMVVMMMVGGHFVRAPFLRWVGLGFPPGGFSRSLPLHDTGHVCICHH